MMKINMYSDKEYMNLKQKYGGYSSWAIWNKEDLCDTEVISRSIKELNSNYVLLALNKSIDIDLYCWKNLWFQQKLNMEIKVLVLLTHSRKSSIQISRGLKIKMQKFASITNSIHEKQKISPSSLTFLEYASHVLKDENFEDKQDVIRSLGEILYIHNKNIYSSLLQ